MGSCHYIHNIQHLHSLYSTTCFPPCTCPVCHYRGFLWTAEWMRYPHKLFPQRVYVYWNVAECEQAVLYYQYWHLFHGHAVRQTIGTAMMLVCVRVCVWARLFIRLYVFARARARVCVSHQPNFHVRIHPQAVASACWSLQVLLW